MQRSRLALHCVCPAAIIDLLWERPGGTSAKGASNAMPCNGWEGHVHVSASIQTALGGFGQVARQEEFGHKGRECLVEHGPSICPCIHAAPTGTMLEIKSGASRTEEMLDREKAEFPFFQLLY